MKISVITAVFNRRNTVGQALDGVFNQTYSNVEYVVQDGGSTDGTVDILAAKDHPQINYVSEPDTGIYDAINRGIERASGDVIGLMHSNDFFADPHVLARVAEAFAYPRIDGKYGNLDYDFASDTNRVIRRWRSGPYSPEFFARGWMPPHPTLYFRREVFENFGLYDTSYRIAADYDAMLRYFAKGHISLAYIPDVLAKMRIGGESNRSLSKIIQKSREDYRAIRKNGVGGARTLAMKNLSKLKQFF